MIKEIREKQKEFQRLVGYPIDSIKEADLLEMSEKYIFKAIEELIELRREFPSMINPWSKEQTEADRTRILEEYADVMLFLINFANIWKLSNDEILEAITFVQDRNFATLKRKKLQQFNDMIVKLPGYTVGVGQGNMNAKYLFVGQNPGKGIPNGYKVWSDENDGSSKVLLPILDKLGIRGQCYFTNIVKSTTENNEEPTTELTDFWLKFFHDEYMILKINNPDIHVIPMGSFAKKALNVKTGIPHPAYVLRGGMSQDQFEEEVRNAL